MSNERQRIRAIVQMQSTRPQFNIPYVSIDELYRDLDEEEYTKKLSWLDLQLKAGLAHEDSAINKCEEHNKAIKAQKFINSFFLFENDGFDPKTLKSIEKELFLQTTPSDPEKEYNQLYFDINCLLSELESEKQMYVNAGDLNARNVLTPVISLVKHVLYKGTDLAKLSIEKVDKFHTLNSELAEKESEIKKLKEEIATLKKQPTQEHAVSVSDQDYSEFPHERTERSYQKIIAILVKSYAHKSGALYGDKDKPNINQIFKELENIMPQGGIYGVGSTSFYNHVKAGLEHLE